MYTLLSKSTKPLLTKSQTLINLISRRYMTGEGQISQVAFQKMYEKVNTSEFPELDRSFMKVLDGEVDKSSASY